tara:strand:+ start:29818 stop:30462 length:645 start_codon:yes stop_codon:yes gene_type:complete
VNAKLLKLRQLNEQSRALIAELIEEDKPTPVPPAADKFRVAVVVGHEPTRPGACNREANLCEFEFNDWIADQMLLDPPVGIELLKVHRHPGTYSALPAKINALNPDLVLSLHCNGYDGEVSGSETLYTSGSSDGARFAGMIQARVLSALHLANRGIKSRVRGDRGGTLLFGTEAPAVIAEPFFIDNDSDLATANSNLARLIDAYLKSIAEFADI